MKIFICIMLTTIVPSGFSLIEGDFNATALDAFLTKEYVTTLKNHAEDFATNLTTSDEYTTGVTDTMIPGFLLNESLTTEEEFTMLNVPIETDVYEGKGVPTGTLLDEILYKEYPMSEEKRAPVFENPLRETSFVEEMTGATMNESLSLEDFVTSQKAWTHIETTGNVWSESRGKITTESTKQDFTESMGKYVTKSIVNDFTETMEKDFTQTTEKDFTESTVKVWTEPTNISNSFTTTEKKTIVKGIVLNETWLEADTASSTKNVLPESTTISTYNDTSQEKEKSNDAELVTFEADDITFENASSTSVNIGLTTSPKLQSNSTYEEANQFTLFMVQKQCTRNKSTEVFDKYPDLSTFVEEVEDCLYFAFIKIRATNPLEIKEALKKFEENQFHVIKVKQNAGNQDKTRLVLKEHLDCKECLEKGKDINDNERDLDLKEIKNEEKINPMHDVNDLSLYLALAGSIITSSVLIANIYLCYCRRKQGHSEIPTFNSKPEKFKMTPIPRPTILNADGMFSQNYLPGRSINPVRSTEQQALGKINYSRNENRDFRESGQWIPQMKQVTPKSERSDFPFIENPTFEVW